MASTKDGSSNWVPPGGDICLELDANGYCIYLYIFIVITKMIMIIYIYINIQYVFGIYRWLCPISV